jgi:hypothetical protein
VCPTLFPLICKLPTPKASQLAIKKNQIINLYGYTNNRETPEEKI